MWPFKKKIKALPPQEGGVAPVIIINDNSDRILDVFGITEERAKELTGIMEKILDKSDTIVPLFIDMPKHCVHQNEFAYCMYVSHVAVSRIGMKKSMENFFKS